MYNSKLYEKGQSVILLAVVVVGLLAITALSIDIGSVFIQRRQAQTAADSAAILAAYTLIDGSSKDALAAARTQVEANGLDADAANTNVEIYNPPTSGEYALDDDYVQVVVTTSLTPVFSQFVFNGTLTTTVEAVARYGKAGGTVASTFGQSAIVGLCETDSCSAVSFIGNATIDVTNGGIFTNSDYSNGGSSVVSVDTGLFGVGNCSVKDFTGYVTCESVDGAAEGGYTETTVNSIPYPPSSLVIPAPVYAAPTCTGSGSVNITSKVATLSPGNFSGKPSGSYTSIVFQPGNYCFSSDLSLSGLTVTGDSVQINMGSNSLTIGGNTTFTVTNSLIYFTNSGTFSMSPGNKTGVANADLSNTTVYLSGSGDFDVSTKKFAVNLISASGPTLVYMNSGTLNMDGQSGKLFTSTNVTYYLNSSGMQINSQTEVNMSAPTSGTYKGLLYYMPLGNTNTIHVNGGSDLSLTGSIISVSGTVWFNGCSSSATFNSQIIGYYVVANGTTTVNLVYNGDISYNGGEAPSSYVELAK